MANQNNGSNNRGGVSNPPRNKSANSGNIARNAGISRPAATSEKPIPPASPSGPNLPGNGQRRLTPKQQAMLKRQRARRRNQIIAASIVVVAVVVIGIIVAIIATTPTTFKDLPTTATKDTAAFTIGDPNAKVTLTEWGDFRCSACDTFYNSVEPAIMSNYVKTNKIKFVFKNFITIDPPGTYGDSHLAAEAGWCASDQSRFWDFYQAMYNNYPGETPGFWTADRLKSLAKQINLDTTKFNACLDNHTHKQDVANQQQEASTSGYTGTPTLLINGTPMTANFADVNGVQSELDAAIAKAGSSTTPGAATTPNGTAAATTTTAASTTPTAAPTK